ncbi:MAG TPA: TolC family protein [Candidatus Dormibacteraeota bacterium]|nr:TolC family protein [Candidatus Dormibacteraeota bacterium]
MRHSSLAAGMVLASLLGVAAQGQTPGSSVPSTAPPSQAIATNPGSPLTLAQAEALALKNNPQITIGKLRALAAQQYVREQRSALLPTANLSVTAVDANPGSRIAAGALNNPILFPRAAAGASVSQWITDFGRTTNLLSSAESSARAEEDNAAATRAQILLAVDQAFYNALETKALVTVATKTVDSRQIFVQKIQALTNAKLKSDLDLSFAKVDEARGRLLLLEAQNNADAALASLSAILGYPDRQEFQLVEEAAPVTPPSLDVTSLIAQALRQRPEIAALQNEVDSAQKFAGAEHDLWRPTVGALGVVGLAPVRDDHIPNWYGAVGININIPVFNGWLYNARAKTADLHTEVSRQRLMDSRNNIARDVRNSWQDANRAYERLSVTQQLREEAALSLDLAQARYNLGLGSIVEFTQAELQETEAEITDTDARYQYRLAELVLAYMAGAPK